MVAVEMDFAGPASIAAVEFESARGCLLALFRRWCSDLAQAVSEAQASGQVSSETAAEELAAFLPDAYEGALPRARVEKSDAPPAGAFRGTGPALGPPSIHGTSRCSTRFAPRCSEAIHRCGRPGARAIGACSEIREPSRFPQSAPSTSDSPERVIGPSPNAHPQITLARVVAQAADFHNDPVGIAPVPVLQSTTQQACPCVHQQVPSL